MPKIYDISSFSNPHVSALRWRIRTLTGPDNGTDSPVSVALYRDGQYLMRVWLEWMKSSRLDSGRMDDLEYSIRGYFDAPAHLEQWMSHGPNATHSIEFPEGVKGHFDQVFTIHGDDMWGKDQIDLYVKYVKLVQGSWEEDPDWTHVGRYPKNTWLSTDRRESKHTTWKLII